MKLVKFQILASSSLMLVWFAFIPNANAQERNRWELISSGASSLGDQSSVSATAPDLTGTDANFLFRLDNLIKAPAKSQGKLDMHLIFDIGVINPARAVTTRTDPGTSPALQIIGVTPIVAATTAGTSISHERAFTAGGQFVLNWLPRAAPDGEYAIEFGTVFKGHFDGYFDNQRFYEKDGITYVKLNQGADAESGFFRGETGLRLRLTQKAPTNAAMTLQDNNDDLLLVEGLVQRASALEPLSRQSKNINAANRYVFRFMALPGLNPKDPAKTKNTKFVIGIEVSNDLHNRGKKDIQLFYGVSANLGKLF